MTFLYWVYDESCKSEIDSGYVGVTDQTVDRRLNGLRHEGNVPNKTDLKRVVLFDGSRDECLERERQLRPYPNMGWNKAAGGIRGNWALTFPTRIDAVRKEKESRTDFVRTAVNRELKRREARRKKLRR